MAQQKAPKVIKKVMCNWDNNLIWDEVVQTPHPHYNNSYWFWIFFKQKVTGSSSQKQEHRCTYHLRGIGIIRLFDLSHNHFPFLNIKSTRKY